MTGLPVGAKRATSRSGRAVAADEYGLDTQTASHQLISYANVHKNIATGMKKAPRLAPGDRFRW